MPPPRTPAVALWSGIQCAALLAAAAGARLWPHHPDPPESLALAELVATQMIAAALLLPRVVGDRWTAGVNIALTVPAIQLAGLLSSTPQRSLLGLTLFVTTWMVGLLGWAKISKGRSLAQAWVIALATLLTVGGAVLWYVRAEWAAQAGTPPPDPSHFGPLLAAVARAVAPTSTGADPGWLLNLVPAVSAVAALARHALRRGRFRPPTSPHPDPESPARPPISRPIGRNP